MICTEIAPSLRHRRLLSSDRPDTRWHSAHLVGVCGSGMKALAEYLIDLGWSVTGSDLQPPSLALQAMQRRGLRIHQGHNDGFVPRDVDVVVYSPAVGPQNPERRLAERLEIRQMSYSEMLGHLMQGRVGVCVAGTHGKSTTTAMTAWCLQYAGLSPSAVIGAELVDSGVSGWAGQGPHFVVESCEYQRNFLNLSPRFAAILGIELDHFDCYGDLSELKASFAEFAERVAADGLVLVRGDCPSAVVAAKHSPARVESFSLDPAVGADWWAADFRQTQGGTRFRIFYQGGFFAEVSLAVPGRHNVANALAAAALAHHAGVDPEAVREGLAAFRGLRRRFQIVGSWRGVTLIDDYAHHPTSVRAILRTARAQFGRRRLWCVFQPHQASRTRHLMQQFAESLASADRVILVPVYMAREAPSDEAETLSRALTDDVAKNGSDARFVSSLDQVVTTLEDEALPGDVVITMGAGDITRIPHEFTGRVRRHSEEKHTARSADLAESRWAG
ncbi:MAG TPA: UDP-N-acetylmuramate--L-alanine ligase [Planctomycetaceae bacterium]|nr:UDP-N-acetylmuramate--L-alanine ligase [Planctomycetaceae bacterium]